VESTGGGFLVSRNATDVLDSIDDERVTSSLGERKEDSDDEMGIVWKVVYELTLGLESQGEARLYIPVT